MIDLLKNVNMDKVIDPYTGYLKYTYYYKNKKCPTVQIKGVLSNKYIGHNLIKRDLDDAEKWLLQAYELIPKNTSERKTKDNSYKMGLGSEENELLIKSLFFSSIIFYGKCFSKAEGRGVKLTISLIDAEYKDKHREIINFRNTLAAHSGKGEWDEGILRHVLPPKNLSNKVNSMIYAEPKRLNYFDDRNDEYGFLKLIQFVKTKVIERNQKIGQKIYKDIIEPKELKYWYKKSKLKIKK